VTFPAALIRACGAQREELPSGFAARALFAAPIAIQVELKLRGVGPSDKGKPVFPDRLSAIVHGPTTAALQRCYQDEQQQWDPPGVAALTADVRSAEVSTR
jgi:hypothetical protein